MPIYSAVQVKQSPGAPPFFLLAVKAAELLTWADIPRKKAGYLAGYQRKQDESRQTILTKYLSLHPNNIIPGAIIVASRPGSVTVTPGPNSDTVQIDVALPPPVALPDLIKREYGEFIARLPEQERKDIESGRYDPPPVDEDDPDEEVDETAQPPSYIGALAQELRGAIEDWNKLPPKRQKAVEDYVRGISKPGFIIDGQHRVLGAKDVVTHDVVLPVVLIPDLPVAEQVFHFYVLNNKAVPLKKTALRATVSTSLSSEEIRTLFTRMDQAGIQVAEAQWTRQVEDHADSPFRALIDFGLGGQDAFISENVMFQVVKAFMRPGKKYSALGAGVPNWEGHDSDAYRMKLFFTLWHEVKAKYPDAWASAVANKGVVYEKGQIMSKAAMIVLQQFLLDDMVADLPKRRQKNSVWSPFSDPKELADCVRGRLHYLPEDFFKREWTEKGLDTSAGHEFLLDQMNATVQKMGQQIGKLPLFRVKKKPGKS
jgi:hypothetical protein